MRDEEFLKEAFKGHDVPAGLKEAVSRIVSAYDIKGVCDPMYIANVIANETGKGNGLSKFWGWDPTGSDTKNAVLDIIRQLEKDLNRPVERSEILMEAAAKNIEYLALWDAVEKLKAEGIIYDPNRDGQYRIV